MNHKASLKVTPVAWGMLRTDGSVLDVICPAEHARHEGAYKAPLYGSAELDAAVAADRERMRGLIADDAAACTFQSLGQYRAALLRALRLE